MRRINKLTIDPINKQNSPICANRGVVIYPLAFIINKYHVKLSEEDSAVIAWGDLPSVNTTFFTQFKSVGGDFKNYSRPLFYFNTLFIVIDKIIKNIIERDTEQGLFYFHLLNIEKEYPAKESLIETNLLEIIYAMELDYLLTKSDLESIRYSYSINYGRKLYKLPLKKIKKILFLVSYFSLIRYMKKRKEDKEKREIERFLSKKGKEQEKW